MVAGTIVNVLVKGKVWKVPLDWALELSKKGWSRTSKVAPNAPKMTRSQLNKVPNKTTAHAAEVAKDLQKGAGRQKTGSSQRGAGTPAAAEARAGREVVAAQKKAAKAKAAAKARKDRKLPVRTTNRQPAKTTGTDVVVSKGRKVEIIPPTGRTPTIWKAMPKSTARSTAKDAAGKNPKGWWAKRTSGQKAAILLATGFGAGALATEEFKKWFGIGGAAVEAQPKPLKPTKLATNGEAKSDDTPAKKKKKVPSTKRNISRADPEHGIGAGRRIRTGRASKLVDAAPKKNGAKRKVAAAKNGPKKKTKKAAELSGLEQFWKDVKDLPKYFGTDLLPEQVSGPKDMRPGKRGYKWEAPFAGEVEFELDSSNLPMEKGGGIKKGMGKTKARKRAALRGGRAELRGG